MTLYRLVEETADGRVLESTAVPLELAQQALAVDALWLKDFLHHNEDPQKDGSFIYADKNGAFVTRLYLREVQR